MSDPSVFHPAIVFPSIASACSLLGVQAMRFNFKRRNERLARLAEEADQIAAAQLAPPVIPDGCVRVLTEGIPRSTSKPLPGSLMVQGYGTPGVNAAIRILITFQQAGRADLIGSVLLFESDELMRDRMLRDIPKIYLDRVVFGYAEAFSGGFGNQSIAQVQAYIGRWIEDVQDTVDRVLKLHLRRNGSAPAEILPFTSLGPHSLLGALALARLHEQMREKRMVVCFDLPVDENLRNNFPIIKPLYEKAGVHGWIATDSLGRDSVTADAALIDLLCGLLLSALQSDQSPRLNNILHNALPETQGGILAFQWVYSDVVSYQHEADPNLYFTNKAQLFDQTKALLRKIECAEGTFSIDVPLGEPRRSVYDLVLAAVDPETMLELKDHVKRARQAEHDFNASDEHNPSLFGKPNYHTLYASFSPPVQPEEPYCTVAVFRLVAVTAGNRQVGEIVNVPEERKHQPGVHESLSVLTPLSSNGAGLTAKEQRS